MKLTTSNSQPSSSRLMALLLAALLTSPAMASPNLVANGNFATGDFTGWVVGGNNTGYPPAVVNTNSACCFGEFVPADPLVAGSPDAGGTHAVYFVDDHANQTLTQTVHLIAGSYAIGFDAYAPHNGFANPGDADFSATIANVLLASYTVHTQNQAGLWLGFSGLADVLVTGDYTVNFDFQTFGPGASADVLIDRVFIAASSSPGGTPIGGSSVPEPSGLLLLALASGAAGLGAKRRKSGT